MMMQSEFNYILVSDEHNGSQFSNHCNEELNFQDEQYEVCMQDIIFPAGAWDNVRVGGNMIKLLYGTMEEKIYYITPGKYLTIKALIKEINSKFYQFIREHRLGTMVEFFFIPAVPEQPNRYFRATGFEIKYCTPYNVGDTWTPATAAIPEYLGLRTSLPSTIAEWDDAVNMKITFSNEIAIMLGIIQHLAAPPKPIK